MTPSADLDRHFLNYAIKLGRRGLGMTAPNPSVGAVVVVLKNDGTCVIVGEGTTAPGGRPHAEPQALAMAGDHARGATLYVSLEPCNHHGKTAPCTDSIIASGIQRVVCSAEDPDPRVSRNGFATLEAAGIAVELLENTPTSVLAHAGHIRSVRDDRPFVILKTAVSIDERIAKGHGVPTWVTGPLARARGHLLRAQVDAILVGAGTVHADDPLLTCRLPGLEHASPVPVVLDTRLRAVKTARLVCDAKAGRPPIVVTGMAGPHDGLDCIQVEQYADGQLVPLEILKALKQRGLTRVLLEGGPTVACSFLQAGLVDEIVVFRGSDEIGTEGLLPFGDMSLNEVVSTADWQKARTLTIGSNSETVYRKSNMTDELMGR